MPSSPVQNPLALSALPGIRVPSYLECKPVTSEDPTDKEHTSADSHAKANNHADKSTPLIPPAVVVPNPPPPSPQHCEITCDSRGRCSVFQSKNEPEGNGKGRRRWSSFQVIYEMSLAVSDLVLERGNGARGKGAAFEPPCLAHPLRSLTRSYATAQRGCVWPLACAGRLRYRSSLLRYV